MTSSVEQPLGFAGGIWLSGPDLWHLGARNLDPTLGRFTTSDPAGFEGGLNLYEYAGSDPVNVIDPTGLTLVGGALVGGVVCAMVLAVNGGDVATAAANVLTNALGEAYFGARALARAAGSRSASALGRLGSQCFGEGTPVETEDGLTPIEDLAIGDRVWSIDPDTGEEGFVPITDTFVRMAAVMELELLDGGSTETLVVTGEHPFWRRESGDRASWTPARELLPGDEVFTSRGGWARVGAGTWLAREQLVYNLEVGSSHTYFVGETGAWVHNACRRSAINAVLSGPRSGRGMAGDAHHRAASWVTEGMLDSAVVANHVGDDGVTRTLVQVEATVNGEAGIFEYIVDPSGAVTHQLFRGGRVVTGIFGGRP